MNTKKISELIALEQVTEQTYLLVEQDGKACRLPLSVLSEYLGTTGDEDGLITFTIDGNEYQAEEGMTWEEWVDSEYNTDGWYYKEYSDGYLVTSELYQHKYGVGVSLYDILETGLQYTSGLMWEYSSFTLGGAIYYGRNDYTWDDWVNSEDNTDGYYIVGAGAAYYLTNEELEKDNNGFDIGSRDTYVQEGDYELVQIEEVPKGDFTFTIDGGGYGATDGMTWGEWCESEFNTSEGLIVISNGSPYYEGFYMSNQNGEQQYEADEIVAGGAYKCDIPE